MALTYGETLGIALFKLPPTPSGNQYLILVADHFSCFSIVVQLLKKAPQIVAQAFLDNVIYTFTTLGVFSDNGKEFLYDALTAFANISHQEMHCTALDPQCQWPF